MTQALASNTWEVSVRPKVHAKKGIPTDLQETNAVFRTIVDMSLSWFQGSSKYPSLNKAKGERAMLIKNNQGDWGLLTGYWEGYVKHEKGTSLCQRHQKWFGVVMNQPWAIVREQCMVWSHFQLSTPGFFHPLRFTLLSSRNTKFSAWARLFCSIFISCLCSHFLLITFYPNEWKQPQTCCRLQPLQEASVLEALGELWMATFVLQGSDQTRQWDCGTNHHVLWQTDDELVQKARLLTGRHDPHDERWGKHQGTCCLPLWIVSSTAPRFQAFRVQNPHQRGIAPSNNRKSMTGEVIVTPSGRKEGSLVSAFRIETSLLCNATSAVVMGSFSYTHWGPTKNLGRWETCSTCKNSAVKPVIDICQLVLNLAQFENSEQCGLSPQFKTTCATQKQHKSKESTERAARIKRWPLY